MNNCHILKTLTHKLYIRPFVCQKISLKINIQYLHQVSCFLNVVPQLILNPGELTESRIQLSSRPIHLIFDQPQLHSQDSAVELIVPLGHQDQGLCVLQETMQH